MNPGPRAGAFAPGAREGVLTLRSSKIRDVANAGMGRPDILPFWFGEPDEQTSEKVRGAAIDHIASGQTFYVQTLAFRHCGKPWQTM
jgi:aspartate/methionine/tyrosine aminotransferase